MSNGTSEPGQCYQPLARRPPRSTPPEPSSTLSPLSPIDLPRRYLDLAPVIGDFVSLVVVDSEEDGRLVHAGFLHGHRRGRLRLSDPVCRYRPQPRT
ncbi:hypothetical protein E2562_012302 [Oryza meyeriana var. granulata]|uniref:Uncharacterized protein n=1 Tax=Oryza meyeriana var. granulata TaxID=110450 RepID=A0A6G1DJA9_9ORYZ|nr:hypothetical protein E2562_012302 [Oryza meyeriana var. granulata]